MPFQFSLHLDLKGKESITNCLTRPAITRSKKQQAACSLKLAGQNDFVVFAGICWPWQVL
jgi:hypothetical protein